MKKSWIYILAIILSAATMSSCREENETISPYVDWTLLCYDLPSEQFTVIWSGMVTSYGMWDIDSTDWQAVYDRLYPEFLKLDERKEEGESIATSELESLYIEAFKTIRDHHFALVVVNQWTDDPNDYVFLFRPGDYEIAQRDEYHDAHLTPYVDNGDLSVHPVVQYLQGLGSRVSELCYGLFESGNNNEAVISALIDGTVPYLHFTSFDLTSLYTEDGWENYPDAYTAYANFRKNVLGLDRVDGVIFDVRDNGGGDTRDEQLLLGLVLDHEVQIGYTRYKAGLGRYDYTPWVPFVFTPKENKDGEINVRENYENPIVVLCNLYSISMSEITSLLTKNLPGGVVIGERTYGGHGEITAVTDAYYSGSFGSTSGPHYCYMSNHTLKTIDGKILEGIGVTPDIEMQFNAEELTHGNDTWIDRAMTYIKTGK